MTLPEQNKISGTISGLLAIGAVTFCAVLVAPTMADQFTATPSIDPSKLVRFEERDYVVDYEDWVATDPITTTRIKKIEAGRVSYVTVTTTATGTYSTDAMFSRHVLYPGITVSSADPDQNQFSYWTRGGWTAFRTGNANSFSYFSVTR